MAISSLPVAARILSDVGLLRDRIGQVVLTVATANDIVGWLLLGVVVSLAERGSVSLGRLAVAVVGMLVVSVTVIGAGSQALDARAARSGAAAVDRPRSSASWCCSRRQSAPSRTRSAWRW